MPNFLAFYNRGHCTTGAPNNCILASHLICSCGFSQSTIFPVSFCKLFIHLNWMFIGGCYWGPWHVSSGGMLIGLAVGSWEWASSSSWTSLSDLYSHVFSSFHVGFNCTDTLQRVYTSTFGPYYFFLNMIISDVFLIHSLYILEASVTFIYFYTQFRKVHFKELLWLYYMKSLVMSKNFSTKILYTQKIFIYLCQLVRSVHVFNKLLS